MTIKRLIELLQKHDEKLKVKVPDAMFYSDVQGVTYHKAQHVGEFIVIE